MMTLFQFGLLFVSCAALLTVKRAQAQEIEQVCMDRFSAGKEDFVLDVDDSVKQGAAFLSSPPVKGSKDCVISCCKDPYCNLALMENGEEGSIKSCFLFDCLYKQKQVCKFVRKTGFSNFVDATVFERYLKEVDPNETDHPPVVNAGQDKVVQPQEIVTLSGMGSTDDNGIVSFQWQLMSGSSAAVMEKTTFDDEVMVSNLSAGVYKFQLTVTDTIGQARSAEITVLVLTPEQSEDHCLMPKKVGPCRGAFPRWHYNAVTEKCEEFQFGGCRENKNNYLSLKECTKACDGVSVGDPSRTGRLGPILPPQEVCGEPCGPNHFSCANGCCIDKVLECDQQPQCSDGSDEQSCTELENKFRRLLEIPVDESKVHCTGEPITGRCRASITKWYYNPYDRMCFRFNYGGCDGNDNNFESEDFCMNICKSVTERDVFARRGIFEKQQSESQTGILIGAAVLALLILIVLAILLYCFLKGKKKKQSTHQRVATNGTYAYTMGDTDKLVYNSTTKPI